METKQTNKKGIQLNTAFPAVLSVVLIGVVVIIGIFIFGSLQSNFDSEVVYVYNETGSMQTTGYTLANSSDCNFNSASILYVTDDTGLIQQAANYTLIGNKVYNTTTGAGGNRTYALINYAYKWGGQPCEASATTITQFLTYPAMVGLVGTIVLLAIVIGVLVISFAFGRSKTVA